MTQRVLRVFLDATENARRGNNPLDGRKPEVRSKKTGLITAAAIAVAGGTGTAALGIVGGAPVQRAAPSWMGSLQGADGDHRCGAALVSSTWVVTARHCLGGDLAQVRLGSLDHSAGGEVVGIADALTDPNGTDVALLRLSTTATSTPVTIASSSPAPGTGITLLGWGQTAPQPGSSDLSPFLKELQTQVLPDSTCNQQGHRLDDGTELCVESAPDQTACYGDSGGPAVADGALVGITSRGSWTCGDSHTVYEDLTALRGWITNITGATSGEPSEGRDSARKGSPEQDPWTPAVTPSVASATNTPVPDVTALGGLHIQDDWWLQSTPTGGPIGVVRNGEVVTVDCQAIGPPLAARGHGNSRIWDHIPGRGFVSDLAVAETRYQKRDPRIPHCPADTPR
jgi:secreted trypsin-like serine protease